jgi:hypothetical protein
MKIFFLLIPCIVILIPPAASAELLVYKGIFKETYIGEGNSRRVNSKVILLIDHATAAIARVEYATVDGIKRYRTSQSTNIHFVEVTGPRGKLWTVLARSPNPCEQQQDSNSEGVFVQGPNATLVAGDGLTLVFPKVLAGGGQGLFYSETSSQPVLAAAAFQAVFNQPDSLTSNNAGETLETALNRYITYVQGLGYQSTSLRGFARSIEQARE